MPNINFWLPDYQYKGWLELSKDEQDELKDGFKKQILRRIKIGKVSKVKAA